MKPNFHDPMVVCGRPGKFEHHIVSQTEFLHDNASASGSVKTVHHEAMFPCMLQVRFRLYIPNYAFPDTLALFQAIQVQTFTS